MQSFRSQDLLELLRNKLDVQFKQFPSDNKCLYVQHELLQVLNFIFDLKLKDFKAEHQITKTYEFTFEDDDEQEEDNSSEPIVVFFLRPDVKNMKRIASMVLSNQSRNIKKEYFVILSPKKTFMCLDQLENLKISSLVKVQSFNFDLIPLEADVLSMELDRPYYQHFIKSNQSLIHLVSESILRLQNALGTFEYHFAKGSSATQILDIVRERYSDEKFEKRESEWEISLFVFDRTVDLVTPMLTPFSYQGLLDSEYPIRLNQVTVPAELVNGKPGEQVPYQINNSLDETYPQIRSMYINFAIELLREKCKSLKDQINEASQSEGSTIQKLQQLKQLESTKGKQYLFCQNHLSFSLKLSQKIHQISFYNRVSMETAMLLTGTNALESIEELAVFNSLSSLLRLISLASALLGGIKDKNLKSIEEIIVRAYGIQHALTMKNLQIGGLIQSYVNRSNWNEIKTRFYLINESVDLRSPNDYSYIFIVYASLIARMVEQGISDPLSWSNNKEKYAMVKGNAHSYRQKHFEFPRKNRQKIAFVYFVGGVTYPEIESLRFLSKKLKTDIVVCTTHITNGNRLIEECFQQKNE